MKIMPNGTKVLIFKYIREWGPVQDEKNYIIGTIQSSKTSDDLSIHGSSWYEQIYEVLGEDGNTYTGNYGAGFVGNSYFRTIEDHIIVLTRRIEDNNKEITKIQEENDVFVRQISKLQEKKQN